MCYWSDITGNLYDNRYYATVSCRDTTDMFYCTGLPKVPAHWPFKSQLQANLFCMKLQKQESGPLRAKCGAECGSHSVVSEVVLLRQLLEQREDLEVVEDVNALYVTEAIVQDSSQLCGDMTHYIMKILDVKSLPVLYFKCLCLNNNSSHS